MSVYGFDISEYQPKINWNIIPDVYQFAICRAGYGEYVKQQDGYFARHMEAALAKGLDVGCYWFVYALDEKSAVNNADAFLKIIRPYIGKITYPLFCDVEGDSVRYMKQKGVQPSKALISSIINAFCRRLESEGFYVGVYSDNGFISQYFTDDILKRFDLWLADWKTNNGKPEGSPRRNCGIWQFTSRGVVKGIDGYVDLNLTDLDYPQIMQTHDLNHLEKIEKPDEGKTTTISGGTVTETDTQIIVTLEKKVK